MKGTAVGKSPPRIESYRFGSITIDGEVYTRDVIVRPEGVLAGWWRREGHSLCPQDLEGALEVRPDCLVIGCGASGVLKVPDGTRQWIAGRGVELVELPCAPGKPHPPCCPPERPRRRCATTTCVAGRFVPCHSV